MSLVSAETKPGLPRSLVSGIARAVGSTAEVTTTTKGTRDLEGVASVPGIDSAT